METESCKIGFAQPVPFVPMKNKRNHTRHGG